MEPERPQNPFASRNCGFCEYLCPIISWWCTNEKAIKARGTAVPGVRDCEFWAPAAREIGEHYLEYLPKP